jgi:hypothetical protein
MCVPLLLADTRPAGCDKLFDEMFFELTAAKDRLVDLLDEKKKTC